MRQRLRRLLKPRYFIYWTIGGLALTVVGYHFSDSFIGFSVMMIGLGVTLKGSFMAAESNYVDATGGHEDDDDGANGQKQ